MRKFLLPALVAAMAVGAILAGGALGLDHAWPVLLAAAVGLAAGPARPGRIAAYVTGATAAWLGAAAGAAALPQTAGARGLVVGAAVATLAAVAAASRQRLPLWAGLAGYAAFAALYQPMYAARPTAFLAESPAALQSILLAGALGFLAPLLADLPPVRRHAETTASASADATVPLWSGAVTAAQTRPPTTPAHAAELPDPIQVVIDLASGGEIADEPAAAEAPASTAAASERERV